MSHYYEEVVGAIFTTSAAQINIYILVYCPPIASVGQEDLPFDSYHVAHECNNGLIICHPEQSMNYC